MGLLNDNKYMEMWKLKHLIHYNLDKRFKGNRKSGSMWLEAKIGKKHVRGLTYQELEEVLRIMKDGGKFIFRPK